MARRVYFAFHYQNDISRVNVVRNCSLTHKDREAAGFFDASLWEKVKETGDDASKRMIRDGLNGTSVTVFLLGAETSNRSWVRYELEESYKRGNGMLAIRIHGIRNFAKQTSFAGPNIFDTFWTTNTLCQRKYLSWSYQLYDWVYEDGYNNLCSWVQQAASDAGR